MARRVRVAALLLVSAALALAPSAAPAFAAASDVNDFAVDAFHADYTLTRDAENRAQLAVVETIVADFPDVDQNRGLIRDIPEYYGDVRLFTQVQSVVDENGNPVPYTTEYYQDAFSVLLGDDSYVHGKTTYVISYTQRDTIRTGFTDGEPAVDSTSSPTASPATTRHDEFYWDVNGAGWSQAIPDVQATLHVDPAIASALTGAAACYQGPNLSNTPCTSGMVPGTDASGSVTYFAKAENLGANEGLTIDVAFQNGTFVEGPYNPPPTTTAGDGDYSSDFPAEPTPSVWESFGALILGAVSLIIGFIASAAQNTNQPENVYASGIIIAEYTPPDDLDVMVAAYLIGRPKTAFPAAIVDLAVKKKVRMLDHPANLPDAPFAVELIDPTGLTELEQAVVDALFDPDAVAGTTRRLAPNDKALGSSFAPVAKLVDSRLKSEGYRGVPRPTAAWIVLVVLQVAIGAFALGSILLGSTIVDGTIAFLGFAAIIWGLSTTLGHISTVAPLSGKGRKVADYLLGMRLYLSVAEEDRLRMLQSPEGAERLSVAHIDPNDHRQMLKLYEKLLPWAVIWGVEDKWSEQIAITAKVAGVTPAWISGSDFSSWSVRSTISGIGRATPEPPRAVVDRSHNSSGSGSGSGGSSFWGGGGGGGWTGGGGSFSSGSSGGGFSGGGGGGGGGRGR